MSYYVQVYKSADLNSPPLSGQSNSSIVLFNACLVDGYSGTVSITGITRSSSTATATVSAADGLKLKTGQILTISGANETDYNGTFTITVASTTTFTYTVANSPTTPSTPATITGTLKLPITSITRGGIDNLTATVILTNANTTLITGNYVTILGCTGTGAAQFNGTFQITVNNSTTFTYQMSSDPGADASGNPVYYKAGLQWTRPFAAGTNSQTYLSQATIGANGETYIPRYLQVIDNSATAGTGKEAQFIGAENMTGDQTYINKFPTTAQQANGVCFRKSTTADSTQRAWTLCGDEKTFIVVTNSGDSNPYQPAGFGYFISVKSGDEYNTFIGANNAFNIAAPVSNLFGVGWLCNVTVTNSMYIARSFTQAGGSIATALSVATTTSIVTATGNVLSGVNSSWLSAPNPSDNGFYVQPLFLQDGVQVLRGRLPGVFGSTQGVILNQYDTITNVVGLSGVTLLGVNLTHYNTNGLALIDMFGPWV